MITYIIQVLLFQVLFLAVYDFFLSKETFHKYNRWYLIGTPLISFILPFIKIPTLQKVVPNEVIVYLPEIVLSPQKVIEQTTLYSESSVNYVSTLFWVGASIFAIVFLIKLTNIYRLILKNEIIKKTSYKLVLLPKQSKAFSFFSFIFLGKEISADKQKQIIKHELIHSKQKHSLDLLFFEFLRIAMWFNPLVYLYQQRITLLHEYITDSEVVKTTEKKDYFNKLLAQTFQVENISFVNQFYKHSFIKKRITMMSKNKSKQIKKTKYLLLLPLLASMLFYTACDSNQVEDTLPKKDYQIRYMGKSNGQVNKSVGTKLTYTDYFIGNGTPDGKKIEYKNLHDEEKKEFDVFSIRINDSDHIKEISNLDIYRSANGRVIIAQRIDFSKIRLNSNVSDGRTNPSLVDEMPTFVINEADVNDKFSGKFTNDFHGHIKRFVLMNFDVSLSKNIGLSKGKKKIWTVFNVDKNGNVVDVKIRAPHPKLKDEVERIIKSLPKMEPAKKDGKNVSMKYTLPISFNVE